jgi:hypothetical protein
MIRAVLIVLMLTTSAWGQFMSPNARKIMNVPVCSASATPSVNDFMKYDGMCWNVGPVTGEGTGDFSTNTTASAAGEMVTFGDTGGKLGARSLFILAGPATTAKTYTFPNSSVTMVYSGGPLGTPSSGNASNLTNFPTLNQNTTGTAAGLTAQYIDWSSGAGGNSIANKPTLAPLDAPYWVSTTVAGLSAEVNLGALSDNNIVAVDISTGVATPRAAAFGDVVVLFGSGSCSGFLKSDGTCETGGGGGLASTDIDTSSELAAIVGDETGSGALVFGTSPAFTTPNLGTPSAATLTNATGLPIGGITGLGSGVGTWLATPSSANLASAVTGETGSGALVFGTSPALTTPDLGTPSALTLTNATGLPIAGITGLGSGVGALLATPSSANLISALTDETGTGAAVFANTPTLVTPVIGAATGTTLVLSGNLTAAGMSSGSSPPALTAGTGGVDAWGEGTGPSVGPAAGVDVCHADSTANGLICSFNNDTARLLGRVNTTSTTTTHVAHATAVAGVHSFGPIVAGDLPATLSSGTAITNAALTTPAITGLATGTGVATANTASTLVARDGSGNFAAGTITAALTGNASTATALATTRAIYGNNFDGSAALTQVIASTYGGTGNGFAKFSGPASAEKTFTLPNADATLTITVASGTKALDTDAIASTACDTLSTTTATGTASTDVILITPNADITAVTGYAAVTTGGLQIWAWPTTDTINWKICNPTSSSITPGAVTLNWRVVR